ncbi:DSBA oxidoreductase [Halopseudomonas oceani]|uniref:2-hydroxychromene-2-carboxylate isomerase n=1 Tax=Halopseudomonas oceani TaxID=1708783 RepID=A0A2P4ES84_9GAMM|nr:DsbA family protein [Halopseudomonas oceani]POB01855.1 disulfide bond formation protein DsbA [Halopseudomonas oceani]GGE54543.1 DSBA oxidoreductase [Halopseudomonas oceani]
MEAVDVYWSFRSPYSYLSTPDMLALQRDYRIKVNLRVVLPIALRSPDILFAEQSAKRARYIVLDWARRAEFLGLPHGWPSPDPVVQDRQTLQVARDQPYIYRLSALGVEAQRRGLGCEFAAEVARLIWGGVAGWDQGSLLSDAVARAGLNLGELEAAIAEGSQLTEIEANQRALEKAGHWGVPTFVFRDEPFFGQDRVDTLRWRLDQAGLAG